MKEIESLKNQERLLKLINHIHYFGLLKSTMHFLHFLQAALPALFVDNSEIVIILPRSENFYQNQNQALGLVELNHEDKILEVLES